MTYWEWEAAIVPEPQRRPRVTMAGGFARAYRTKADSAYRDVLQMHWMAVRPRIRPMRGDLAVRMEFAGNKGIRPDATNLAKAVEDAANGVLWLDDRQVVDLGVTVKWAKGVSPLVRVAVWTLDGDSDKPRGWHEGTVPGPADSRGVRGLYQVIVPEPPSAVNTSAALDSGAFPIGVPPGWAVRWGPVPPDVARSLGITPPAETGGAPEGAPDPPAGSV